jgi:hypothetical protein
MCNLSVNKSNHPNWNPSFEWRVPSKTSQYIVRMYFCYTFYSSFFVCELTLLDLLRWTRWSCSCLLFYIDMLLHIRVLFMVLFPGFLELDFM